jgi:polyisoprenoid-binding protein YceI
MSATDVARERLAGAWTFDAIHSAATFSVKYLVAPFRAEFARFEATLQDGRLAGTVDVASLKVKDEHFAQTLQGPEFFDGERFPAIAFGCDAVALSADDVVLDGELTLRGVTRPLRAIGTIEGPTEDFMGNVRLGLTLSATIDRTDYGLGWNAPLPMGGFALSDEVALLVDLEFIAT